jgi:putative NADH-flavin reductase
MVQLKLADGLIGQTLNNTGKLYRTILKAIAGLALVAIAPHGFGLSPVMAKDAPRIVIVGATSKSAKELIPQALDRGFEVVGLARRPDAVTFEHERFTVVKGDVYVQDTLESAFTGNEVVISMVGPRENPYEDSKPTDLLSTGTLNIIQAMKIKGNTRLLVASSIGVENDFPETKPDNSKGRAGWLWKRRHRYLDMQKMEVIVRDSGLEYVIFRPSFLVEEPIRHDLILAVNEPSPKAKMITYADFAEFVLDQVQSPQHLGDAVGMFSDRVLKFGKNVDFEALAQDALKAREVAGANK